MSSDAESYSHIKQCLDEMARQSQHAAEADGRGQKQLKVVRLPIM